MHGIVMLAYVDAYHYIAQHAHECLQLRWGGCCVQLHMEDMPTLAHLVASWTPEQPHLTSADGSYAITLDQQGYIQLWMVESGLRLRPEAFFILTWMIAVAAQDRATDTVAYQQCAGCPFRDPYEQLRQVVLPQRELLN
jgi:hypothetical protein